MPQPTAYTRQADFTSYEASNPSTPKRGEDLDAEFDALKVTTDDIRDNLALIQADDGTLKNESVHPDAFDEDALALMGGSWTPRGAWATATLYEASDVVSKDSASYVCAVEHTSGTFNTDLAAGKWIVLGVGVTQATLETIRDAALAAQAAAETAETNAETAETNAETAATNAANSASAASTSATNAATSATNASNSATAAAGSATTASTAATAAQTAQAAAELAETNAETAEANAETAQAGAEAARDEALVAAARNRLINGEFRIWQRGTSLSAQADDTYGAMGDRWYILTQTGTIAGARQDNPFDGARNSGQLTQSQASAQRIGAAQIIEGKNCIDLRGQAVTFYGRFKISANQAVRLAILEWTGTEDSVTSDVVNDWTSADYGEGAARFFVDTNFTITAVKGYASPGTSWVDFFVTGTLGSSMNNLVVFVWTEGTAAQNVTLSLANCGLIKGSVAPAAHAPRSFSQELALCQRYYTKSFAIDTAPAQNSGVVTGAYAIAQTVGAAGGQRGFSQPYPVVMRAAPTVTTYNPSAANAQARNVEVPADCSAISVGGASGLANERVLTMQWTTGAGTAAGQFNVVHYSATVEL